MEISSSCADLQQRMDRNISSGVQKQGISIACHVFFSCDYQVTTSEPRKKGEISNGSLQTPSINLDKNKIMEGV